MAIGSVIILTFIAVCAALPTDRVISTLGNLPRFTYADDAQGHPHLVDSWLKASDVREVTRYSPDTQNVYHLFTRDNPTVSQPLLVGENGLLGITNYNAQRRTIVLLHGWLDDVTADFNAVLVPAFLAAENVNVIVVDWSAGGGTINYVAALANTVTSGRSVANFLNWLITATGTQGRNLHLVGHSLGAHQAGIIGRSLTSKPAYITGLDPAMPGWISNDDKLREDDAEYTEVIHTNAGLLGYLATLGHVDFYPNGGIGMPGCSTPECDHLRSFYYLGESLTTSIFTGRRCATYIGAMAGQCLLFGNLHMGGLVPKTGSSGIYYLETNASPPFSRG